MKLTRTTINFWLDSLLLVIFLALLWSAAIVHAVFPPGTSAEGWRLWGWGYGQWSQLNFALICTLALGVLVHVMLHWTWVCGVVAGYIGRRKGAKPKLDDGLRTLYGVGTLIVVLHVVGIGVVAAWLTIQSPEIQPQRGHPSLPPDVQAAR